MCFILSMGFRAQTQVVRQGPLSTEATAVHLVYTS